MGQRPQANQSRRQTGSRKGKEAVEQVQEPILGEDLDLHRGKKHLGRSLN